MSCHNAAATTTTILLLYICTFIQYIVTTTLTTTNIDVFGAGCCSFIFYTNLNLLWAAAAS